MFANVDNLSACRGFCRQKQRKPRFFDKKFSTFSTPFDVEKSLLTYFFKILKTEKITSEQFKNGHLGGRFFTKTQNATEKY